MTTTTKHNKESPLIASLLGNDTLDGPKFGIFYQLWMERKRNPNLESAFRKSALTKLPTAAPVASTSTSNIFDCENAEIRDEPDCHLDGETLTSPNQTNAGAIAINPTCLSVFCTDDQPPTAASVASKPTSVLILIQGTVNQLPTAALVASSAILNRWDGANAEFWDELDRHIDNETYTSPKQTNTGTITNKPTSLYVQGTDVRPPTAAFVANKHTSVSV